MFPSNTLSLFLRLLCRILPFNRYVTSKSDNRQNYIYIYFFRNLQILFLRISGQPPVPTNPCQPSPCGPNAECQVRGDSSACSCIENYIGVPPNCRPQCTINPECPPHLACMQQKCRDPCVGLCGLNAQCTVVNHHAVCACVDGYSGNPFSVCEAIPEGESTKEQFFIFLSFFFSYLQISSFACRRSAGKC